MTTLTPHLRLNVPLFDQMPWDEDVNTNWALLDATIGMVTAIPNLVGVWKNATSYTYGQTVIDSADSSIWTCVQTHLSSPAPLSFANERISFPARWGLITNGASFYAAQAATSAADAAASAAAAAASAGSVTGVVLKAGDTMTGFLTLHSDPTANMHASTKQYVDARVGGVGFLPSTGGILTGNLEVGGNGVSYTNQAANKHVMSFGWNGSAHTTLVDGVATGNLATQAYVSGSFLPISGGTITGALTVNGQMNTASTYAITGSGAAFSSDASYSHIQWDAAGWKLRYTRASGVLEYLAAGVTQLFSINGSGGGYFLGGMSTGGSVAAAANVYARGGNVYWGAGDRSHLYSDNSTFTYLRMLDLYGWHLNWATGLLAWERFDGTGVFTIDPSGHTATGGNLTVASNILIGNGAAGRILQLDPGGGGWHWSWNISNGNVVWVGGGLNFFEMRASDGLCGNNINAMYGVGAYINASDERIKLNIRSSPYGLDAVMQLAPIEFSRLYTPDRIEHGFSAQQVQKVLPEAVSVYGQEEEDPMLGVSLDPIVVALVNGMKELATRMSALEDK
jgi:hypothetical protein